MWYLVSVWLCGVLGSLGIPLNDSFFNKNDHFPVLRPIGVVPSYILTKRYENTVHRFFDSSPISSSRKYVATTSFPSFSDSNENNLANVNIVHLDTGVTDIIAQTYAWDSQVGAQVQWGNSDEQLFYNTITISASNNDTGVMQATGCNRVQGVLYNKSTRHSKLLDCPVYHVSSDAQYGVAPNMLKIHNTQKGYGVRPLDSMSTGTINHHAPVDDGMYLTNIPEGTCSLLVTLHHLADVAGIDLHSTPMYGFHTKFSSDGLLVMFVVRTLEQPVSPRISPVRVQHLFVSDISGTNIRRLISWASYPFRPKSCLSKVSPLNATAECSVVHLRDGNHPNWVPNTHKISMNLQKASRVDSSGETPSLFGGVAKLTNLYPKKRQIEWNIVTIDADLYPSGYIYRYHMNIHIINKKLISHCRSGGTNATDHYHHHHNHQCVSAALHLTNPLSALYVELGHTVGSGHPIYHPSGKYIITDAYRKEVRSLTDSVHHRVLNGSALRPLSVPLRLIEVETQREVWLLQVCYFFRLSNKMTHWLYSTTTDHFLIV